MGYNIGIGRNKIIYPKEWVALRPYDVADEADRYYVQMANNAVRVLEKSAMRDFFDGDLDLLRKAGVYLSMWFEDICSNLGIWQTVNRECAKRYGAVLPFYDTSEYYEGEVNVQDLALLLWHFMQTFADPGTIINPENAGLIETAADLADLFDNEYETAPENTRLRDFIHNPAVADDWWKCRELIEWFYLYSYVFVGSFEDVADAVEELLDSYNDMDASVPDLSWDIMDKKFYLLKIEHIFGGRHNLLSLTAAQWCGKITGNPVFDTVHRYPTSYYLYKGLTDNGTFMLQDMCDGKEYEVENNSYGAGDSILSGSKVGETVMVTNLASFKDMHYVVGVTVSEDKSEVMKEVEAKRRNDRLMESQKEIYPLFLKASKGEPAVFVKDLAEMKAFYKQVMPKMSDNFPIQVIPTGATCVGIYCDPVVGIYVAAAAGECVALPSNRFYDKEAARKSALGFYCDADIVTYRTACILHDRDLIPDAALTSVRGYEHGRDFLHRNGRFFIDYFYECCRELDYDPYCVK